MMDYQQFKEFLAEREESWEEAYSLLMKDTKTTKSEKRILALMVAKVMLELSPILTHLAEEMEEIKTKLTEIETMMEEVWLEEQKN